MGWGKIRKRLKKSARKMRDKGKEVISDATQNPIDVVRGKQDLDDAIKDTVGDTIDFVREGVELSAEINGVIDGIQIAITKRVGGERAADLTADIRDVVGTVTDANFVAQYLDAINVAIRDGEFDQLNPFVVLAASRVEALRKRLWDQSHAIPAHILSSLPSEVQALATDVRVLELSEVSGNIDIARVAIKHQDAHAITLVDLIIWEHMPVSTDPESLHTWTHELYHVGQYREKGTAEFMARFLGNEFGFSTTDGENAVEVEADVYACQFFPAGHPKYLPGEICP